MLFVINRKLIGVNVGIKFKFVKILILIEVMSYILNCNGRLVIFKILFLLNLGFFFWWGFVKVWFFDF